MERQWLEILRALDQMERDAVCNEGLHIGHIYTAGGLFRPDYRVTSFGATLDGVDPTYEWRHGRPAPTDWCETILALSSMRFAIDDHCQSARYERPVPDPLAL